MVEVNGRALTEVLNRGEGVAPRTVIEVLERHHPTDEPGIAWETLTAYADAMADEREGFDAESFLDTVEDRLTAIDVWSRAIYELDNGHISAHPSEWHDPSGLNETVLEEVQSQRRTLLIEDVLELIERYHPHDQPGVSRATLEAYARRFGDMLDGEFDAEEFLAEVDTRVVKADTWADPDAFYRIDATRVSRYPPSWHDSLGDSADVTEYVRFLTHDAPGFSEGSAPSRGAGRGVPEQFLLGVVSLVGRVDRQTAKSRLEDRRDHGELIEDADQHPDASVRLADDTDE